MTSILVRCVVNFKDVKGNIMTPIEHQANIHQRQSKRMKELFKKDNKIVGNFSGMKSSFRDESHTHEINKYMELRQ